MSLLRAESRVPDALPSCVTAGWRLAGLKHHWPFKSKRVGQLKKDLALSKAECSELSENLSGERGALVLSKAEVSELLANVDQQQDEIARLKQVGGPERAHGRGVCVATPPCPLVHEGVGVCLH